MKTIILEISDKVYNDLMDLSGLRVMVDKSFGIIDASIGRILEAVENGDEKVILQYKDE